MLPEIFASDNIKHTDSFQTFIVSWDANLPDRSINWFSGRSSILGPLQVYTGRSLSVITPSSPHYPARGGQGAGAEVNLDVQVVPDIGGDVLHLVLSVNVGRPNHGDGHCVTHQ